MSNYQFQTTFWSDFSIADVFGKQAIKDTFNRAFKEWKDNHVYLTELAIVTNWKCWDFYHAGKHDISQMYADYYYKCREYALDHYKGKELAYYLDFTD